MLESQPSQRQDPIPFLKWAGGKRWLTGLLPLPAGGLQGSYIEPFLGSAAVFFSLAPEKAILSDSNKELIDTYKTIVSDPSGVQRNLRKHQARHSEDHYYFVRQQNPRSPVIKAARFIYLNRVCWNGLYRVNQAGKFNVPIGTKSTVLLESDDFHRVSELLKGKDLEASDFESTIAKASKGDLIFADPPYTVRHKFNGFVKYNEKLFSWSDQVRLRDALKGASKKGANIICTNADHESIREIYKKGFKTQQLDRYSSIAGRGGARGNYSELLITNF